MILEIALYVEGVGTKLAEHFLNLQKYSVTLVVPSPPFLALNLREMYDSL